MCHVSPEAAEGGAIALIKPGDMVDIDIPARAINVRLSVLRMTASSARKRNGPMSSGRRNSAPPRPISPPSVPIIAPPANALQALRRRQGSPPFAFR